MTGWIVCPRATGRIGSMEDKTELTTTEDRNTAAQVERRSLSAVVSQFAEGTAWGGGVMVGGLAVKDAYEKAKDVVAPKDEGPKVELPPGVKGD
jgi:hypothetical protein